MKFDIYLNFDGQCKNTLALYPTVFKAEVQDFKTVELLLEN
ncbi:hypothetical protein [Enterococcus sp. CWB-B31]|nr:hypothetical protein [Enterococcus sp. CWB-B31]